MNMPEWFSDSVREARKADQDARLAAMPRIKFLFGKDWGYGPWCYAFGVMWDKDPAPKEGAYIYRRRIILHMTFHLSLER